MRLEVSYSSSYVYDPPPAHALTALRMRPRTRTGLIVERSELRAHDARVVRSYIDGFGTNVDIVETVGRRPEARFEIEALVETPAEGTGEEATAADLVLYRQDSRRVRAESVLPVAGQLELDPAAWASIELVVSCLPQWFTYQIGVTHAETTLEEVIEGRAGVCQDFAHILIGIARLWGYPARYASGYMYTGDRSGGTIEATAMHAWVQVHHPAFGWVGLDATTGGYADETYIPVAYGRDYDDVRPVRGVLSGGPVSQSHASQLSVSYHGQQ